MSMDLAWIAAALALLFLGAEGLVRGSASLALRFGLSPLMVGLTIVAFGTSSPELVVSIKAALAQQGDIAVGNVIGSNSFNIGIILGLTALVCPIPVQWQIIKIDAPVALGVSLLPLLLLWDRTLGRVEGLVLCGGIAVYIWASTVLGRRQAESGDGEKAATSPVPPIPRHWSLDLALIAGGLAVLVLGSRLLVDHSVALAKALGVGEAVIGLTIVAAGTSMPELATSLVAAVRRQPDIAIGNIVGSNIFNILAILGSAALVSPLQVAGISHLDYAASIVFTVLLLPLLYTGRLLHRIEGGLLLALYGVYLFLIWPH